MKCGTPRGGLEPRLGGVWTKRRYSRRRNDILSVSWLGIIPGDNAPKPQSNPVSKCLVHRNHAAMCPHFVLLQVENALPTNHWPFQNKCKSRKGNEQIETIASSVLLQYKLFYHNSSHCCFVFLFFSDLSCSHRSHGGADRLSCSKY